MSEAQFIRTESSVNIYRCKNCHTEFQVGDSVGWFNCFYCCRGCAESYNRCSKCGDNRNWCECKKRESNEYILDC